MKVIKKKYNELKQKKITDKLINNIELIDEGDFEASYKLSDDDHQARFDNVIQEFADASVGSERRNSDD